MLSYDPSICCISFVYYRLTSMLTKFDDGLTDRRNDACEMVKVSQKENDLKGLFSEFVSFNHG